MRAGAQTIRIDEEHSNEQLCVSVCYRTHGSTLTKHLTYTLGMIFCMYRILYAMSIHYEHRSGQSKEEFFVPSLFPPKNREKIHISISQLLFAHPISQHVY